MCKFEQIGVNHQYAAATKEIAEVHGLIMACFDAREETK